MFDRFRFISCGFVATVVAVSFLGPAVSFAGDDKGESPKPRRGFIDLNGYFDTREFAVQTINLFAKLPYRLEYFSLTNFFNAVEAEHPEDLDTYYTEQNLRYSPFEKVPLDAAMQWMHRSGTQNDILRVGARWRLMNTPLLDDWFARIGLVYFVNFYVGQFDDLPSQGTRMQIEHVYKLPILRALLDERVYLGGFLDHNLWFDGPAGTDESTIVTEHQLGVRLVDHLYAVAEFRRNEFLPEKKNGVGFGLEYVVPFTVSD